jgi:hypothetical protein
MNLRALSPACLLVAAALMAGCQTHGLSEQTQQKLTYVQTEVSMGRGSVVQVGAMLRLLRDADPAQVKPTADAYGRSVQNLEDKAGGVGFVLEMADQRATEHFAKWEKTITDLSNADLQASATERKNEMAAAFDDVRTKMNALRTDFRPFMSRLKDIQKAITADATAAGRNAMLPSIKESIAEEGRILRDIDALDRSIEKLKNK